jgi:hypothetical protein
MQVVDKLLFGDLLSISRAPILENLGADDFVVAPKFRKVNPS